MVELVDTGDSKSPARKGLPVRVRSPVPLTRFIHVLQNVKPTGRCESRLLVGLVSGVLGRRAGYRRQNLVRLACVEDLAPILGDTVSQIGEGANAGAARVFPDPCRSWRSQRPVREQSREPGRPRSLRDCRCTTAAPFAMR